MPRCSTLTVTGFVVPRIVRSPSTAYSPFDFGVTFVLLKTISGWLSASRKSAERRWASRFSSLVLTFFAGMRSSMPPASGLAGSNSMTPVAPPNPPRTVVSIMCFTAAVMVVWLGSICHCMGVSSWKDVLARLPAGAILLVVREQVVQSTYSAPEDRHRRQATEAELRWPRQRARRDGAARRLRAHRHGRGDDHSPLLDRLRR